MDDRGRVLTDTAVLIVDGGRMLSNLAIEQVDPPRWSHSAGRQGQLGELSGRGYQKIGY